MHHLSVKAVLKLAKQTLELNKSKIHIVDRSACVNKVIALIMMIMELPSSEKPKV